MSKKYSLWVSFVLLLSMAAVSFAIDVIWTNGGSDGDWNNTANWSPAKIPNSTIDKAKIPIATGPVFSVGRTATAYRVLMQGTNGTITMDGGNLTTNNYLDIGYGASDSGTLTVNSGTINVTTYLYCGRDGAATINMSGGAINIAATFYVARDPTSTGTVNLSGGTISCNVLSIELNPGATGLIDITAGGTLIINGNAIAAVDAYVIGGEIKAYDGAGTVLVDYNSVTDKTTVTASVPTKAGVPSPANYANNVSTLTDLSWVGIIEAVSHDVYFGTISPGAFQQNQTETTFDPCVLNPNTTYYWRIDEVNNAHPNSPWTGDVWMFTTGSVIATLPNPADGAINMPINTTLSWTAGVTASSHDVYFGTISPGASQGNQSGTTFDPGALAVDTTYYWRIDEVEDINNTYIGTVWSFSTQGLLKKGPYLIYPGSNTQMTVLWQMTTTTGCTLEWGLDTGYSSGSTGTSEYGDHQHKYTITGLTPGTKYYYRVTAGAAQVTGSFQTAPATDATSVKFLMYGDTRTNPGDHDSVAAGMIATYNADPAYQTMTLLSGDWVNDNTESNWTDQFFNYSYGNIMENLRRMPIQGCMGNHEGSGTVYMKYWPYPYVANRYWSFDYGPVHIVILDQYPSSGYSPGSDQYNWLVSDLSTSTKPWKIIVLHQPGWTAGGHPNESNVQNYIQPLCELYGVQIVVAGHNHYYARAVVNDVHHITSGGGGAPLYSPVLGHPKIVTINKTLHYCKVAIDGNSLEFQAVKPDGTVIDSFYIDKDDPDFTFIQATDPQMTYCAGSPSNWQVTINKVNILNPAFLIVTGDLLNSPGSQYQADLYFDAAAGLNPGITRYDIPGNHDLHDAPTPTSYSWYEARFGNTWYSFTYGNNLFITLESNILRDASGYPGKDVNEIDWLTTTLSGASGYDNILVFMHHPLCVSSISEPYAWNNMPTARRSELLTLFHTYGVRAVFAGHLHQNAYVRDGDLEIITTSSCTCPLAADPPGFRMVEVYPNHISHTYRTLDSIVMLAGDYNGDGTVDFNDVGILKEHWLDSGMWP